MNVLRGYAFLVWKDLLKFNLMTSFVSGSGLEKLEASNEELSANFHRTNQLGQRNTSMCSAPLGMLCFDSIFSLLARILPWNGHRLEMVVTHLRWLTAKHWTKLLF